MIYIEHGERKSLGRDANLALYYWLLARCPSAAVTIPKESLLAIQEAPKGLPQPGQQVIVAAVAACEREFGKTPTYDDSQDIVTQSRSILDWLTQHGDIAKMEER